MVKQIIHIIFILFFSIAFSQKSIELVDGKILETKNSIYQNPNVTNETAANDYIGVYQKYISGIRGQECPMYPSCSNFGLKVFKEKDFYLRLLLPQIGL